MRLIGVDTPEVYGHAECFGREASAFVRRLVPVGSTVRYRLGVESATATAARSPTCGCDDGRFLNALLVERGYAQPLTIPPNVDYAARFRAAARRAREAGRGLWARSGCATSGG